MITFLCYKKLMIIDINLYQSQNVCLCNYIAVKLLNFSFG